MSMELGAKKILVRLEENGYEGYYVGGFVRDKLINRETNDIDIATNATPTQVMGLFLRTIPTGIKHGTVTVILAGFPFEITSYRSDLDYHDFRRPSNVKYVASIEEDLSRRDFTINAMAMNKDGVIIDPFNGLEAISQQLIVTVGNPKERFLEDPLRMMRAIRFSAQLNFNIEEQTLNSIIENAGFLKYIAIERVKQEMDKIMLSSSPQLGIKLLFESGLIKWIKGVNTTNLLEIDYQLVIEQLKKTDEKFTRWICLVSQLEDTEQVNVFTYFRFSNKEKRIISRILTSYRILIKDTDLLSLKKLLVTTSLNDGLVAITILSIMGKVTEKESQIIKQELIAVDHSLKVKNIKDLAITGKDLISYFNEPVGAWVKTILEELFNQVVFYELKNDFEELLSYAILVKEGKKNEK